MIIVYIPNDLEVATRIQNMESNDYQLVRYLADLSVERPRSVEMYDTDNAEHMHQFVVNNNTGCHADKLVLVIERNVEELRSIISDVRNGSNTEMLAQPTETLELSVSDDEWDDDDDDDEWDDDDD